MRNVGSETSQLYYNQPTNINPNIRNTSALTRNDYVPPALFCPQFYRPSSPPQNLGQSTFPAQYRQISSTSPEMYSVQRFQRMSMWTGGTYPAIGGFPSAKGGERWMTKLYGNPAAAKKVTTIYPKSVFELKPSKLVGSQPVKLGGVSVVRSCFQTSESSISYPESARTSVRTASRPPIYSTVQPRLVATQTQPSYFEPPRASILSREVLRAISTNEFFDEAQVSNPADTEKPELTSETTKFSDNLAYQGQPVLVEIKNLKKELEELYNLLPKLISEIVANHLAKLSHSIESEENLPEVGIVSAFSDEKTTKESPAVEPLDPEIVLLTIPGPAEYSDGWSSDWETEKKKRGSNDELPRQYSLLSGGEDESPDTIVEWEGEWMWENPMCSDD